MRKTIVLTMSAVSLLALSACRVSNASGNATTETTTNTVATNATASTAGSIDGTWKADLTSVKIDTKPDQYLLKGGQFSCPTCTPPLTIAADGAMHSVTGRPYADNMSVKVDDDHHVTQLSQKGGKPTGETKYAVSADGKTLTIGFTDSSVANAKPVTGSLTETRVADGPAGAHALSGSWKLAKYDNVSDEGLTVTYKVDGDTIHMSAPSGVSYEAKLDGTDAPLKGDVAGTMVSVKKLADGSFEETDKRDGKVITVTTFMPGSDGKLHFVSDDKRNGTKMTYDANKS